MTYDQFEEIVKEQHTRIFALHCTALYETFPHFKKYHFEGLRKNDIRFACWETLIKLKFPFESIVPHVEFALFDSKRLDNLQQITGVSFKLSLYILNLPEMDANHFKNLVQNFIETFDRCLTHDFNIPFEIKRSDLILDIEPTHSFFKLLSGI